MDDYCPKPGFRSEHGLSFLVEAGNRKILFDTGQSSLFLSNAEKLNLDLSSLDIVVLSHGHYDHGGGLHALVEMAGTLKAEVVAGQGFDGNKSARTADSLRDVGISAFLPEKGKWRVKIVDSVIAVGEGVFILPRAELFDGREPNKTFRTGTGALEAIDRFEDELSMVVVEDDGMTVITGCAHRGIENILESARRTFPGQRLKSIVGGFHLVNDGIESLDRVSTYIARLLPQSVYCCHCTGLKGYAVLDKKLPGIVSWLSCGSQMEI